MPVEVLNSLTLRLLHTDRVCLDKRWRYDHVISPFSRLYLATEGEGWVFHNGHRYTLKPNYVYLIPAYSLSQYHCESYLEQTYVHFLEEMQGGYSVYTSLPLRYEVQATPLDHLLFAQLVALHPDQKLAKSDPKAYDNRSRLLSFNQPQMPPHRLLETQGILLQLLSRFIAATVFRVFSINGHPDLHPTTPNGPVINCLLGSTA